MLYKIQYKNKSHEIFEIYHPHCFKIMDLIFIKKGRKSEEESSDDSDTDSADEGNQIVKSNGTLVGSLFRGIKSQSGIKSQKSVKIDDDSDNDDYEVFDQLIASIGLDRRIVILSLK